MSQNETGRELINSVVIDETPEVWPSIQPLPRLTHTPAPGKYKGH